MIPQTTPVGTGIEAATQRALEVRALYEVLEQRLNGKVWSLHEHMLGFTNDVGMIGRLILANDGTWDIDGDVTEQLKHKLAESMWWVMVLADRLDINMAEAFTSTMDRIEDGLGNAIGTNGS
jgi:NTP pyrophosphatase (non-canonical NTP hydrolase)